MKKNIGKSLVLYPTPLVVVGTNERIGEYGIRKIRKHGHRGVEALCGLHEFRKTRNAA